MPDSARAFVRSETAVRNLLRNPVPGAGGVKAGVFLGVNKKHIELHIGTDCRAQGRRNESPIAGISHGSHPRVTWDREVVCLDPCNGLRGGGDKDVVVLQTPKET